MNCERAAIATRLVEQLLARQEGVGETPPVDVANVSSVYSGRPGCCCGCRGKHSYASQHRDWASRDRGYEVSDDEVSDLAVHRLTNRFNQLIAAGDPGVEFTPGELYAYETPTRQHVIYLKHERSVPKQVPKQ